MTRYTMLREAIANLAASAEAQVAYLDKSFEGLTGGGSAAAYGNEELALEFDDIFIALNHMLDHGEVTEAEIDAIRPLDAMLRQLLDDNDSDVWMRDALFGDPRWARLRDAATAVLARLPDELRESDYTRGADKEHAGWRAATAGRERDRRRTHMCLCWTGFAVAMLGCGAALLAGAPGWISNLAIAAAFLFGLAVGTKSIRRQWCGKDGGADR